MLSMSPRLFPVELDPVPNRLEYLDLQGEIVSLSFK
jgi:hypothetical protein